MSAWNDLVKKNVNKWDEAGYPFVSMEKIIDKSIIIDDFELFNSKNFGQGVRILFNCGDKLRYTVTFSQVIVRVFTESQNEVRELIKIKEPVKIVWQKSQNGSKYLDFE